MIVNNNVLLVTHDAPAAVLHIVLNRPDALNAFNLDMHAALMAALNDAAQRPSVRVIVLTGAGRAFCAGQDLGERRTFADNRDAMPPDLGVSLRARYNPLVQRLLTMPKPVIAAVNGIAAGAGAGLACACDMRIGGESAAFLFSFANVGLGLDTGLSYTLPRLIGTGRALDVSLRGGRIAAIDAERIGLLTRVVPDIELDAAARSLAAELASKSAGSLAAIKQAIIANADAPLSAALETEAVLQAERGHSAGYREGLRAFFGKRRADFWGVGD